MIAVLKIPEKEPWCSATEFRAREITIGHITEANSPIAGKAITETLAGPNKAADKQNRAPNDAPISTLRLSNIFSSSKGRNTHHSLHKRTDQFRAPISCKTPQSGRPETCNQVLRRQF